MSWPGPTLEYLVIELELEVIFGFHHAGTNCNIPGHYVLVSSVI